MCNVSREQSSVCWLGGLRMTCLFLLITWRLICSKFQVTPRFCTSSAGEKAVGLANTTTSPLLVSWELVFPLPLHGNTGRCQTLSLLMLMRLIDQEMLLVIYPLLA